MGQVPSHDQKSRVITSLTQAWQLHIPLYNERKFSFAFLVSLYSVPFPFFPLLLMLYLFSSTYLYFYVYLSIILQLLKNHSSYQLIFTECQV